MYPILHLYLSLTCCIIPAFTVPVFCVMGIFSREAVVMPKEENGQLSSDLNCHGYGSAVAVTASFGMAAAGWCLDQVGAT